MGASSTGSPSVWGAGTTDSSEIADQRPEEDFRDDRKMISELGLQNLALLGRILELTPPL